MMDALNDDLDSPRALQVLRRLDKDEAVEPGAKFETFAAIDRVLGLDLVREVGSVAVMPAGAQQLFDARLVARAEKNWAESDRLRDELAAMGVIVRDTAAGSQWELA